ncbi:SpoIIIAH-like family protein [Paenibacillus sp. GCM10027627]|uniref:SpoIIIAH-like family protein n=1 Tax=unclassified Paenibacillus TaxID=185978 RepID=UPI003628F9EC
MNTKRQTIWLVSMLSLMVVLSAYYLFTQDIKDADKLSEGEKPGQNVTEVAGKGEEVVVDEVLQSEDQEGISAVNEQLLEKLEREGLVQGGIFSELLAKRDKQYEEEHNRILSVIADVNNEPDKSAAAFAEMEKLEDKNSRIQTLESALMEQYQIALVSSEANDRYKVVVTSEKLEKKEAAGIIDQVTTALEIDAAQVSVQYVPEP